MATVFDFVTEVGKVGILLGSLELLVQILRRGLNDDTLTCQVFNWIVNLIIVYHFNLNFLCLYYYRKIKQLAF